MSRIKEPIPMDLVRPIVQGYLDKYETAPMEQIGNWSKALSPLPILASEAGIPERRLRRMMDDNEYCDFNVADNLFCAMGYGLMGWLGNSDELREHYYSVKLNGNYGNDGTYKDAPIGDTFRCGHATTEENCKPDLCRPSATRYFRCRECYNARKRRERSRSAA